MSPESWDLTASGGHWRPESCTSALSGWTCPASAWCSSCWTSSSWCRAPPACSPRLRSRPSSPWWGSTGPCARWPSCADRGRGWGTPRPASGWCRACWPRPPTVWNAAECDIWHRVRRLAEKYKLLTHLLKRCDRAASRDAQSEDCVVGGSSLQEAVHFTNEYSFTVQWTKKILIQGWSMDETLFGSGSKEWCLAPTLWQCVGTSYFERKLIS